MGNSQLSMSPIQSAVKVSALCAALNWLILRFPVVLTLFLTWLFMAVLTYDDVRYVFKTRSYDETLLHNIHPSMRLKKHSFLLIISKTLFD